jgi:hypothetical protein
MQLKVRTILFFANRDSNPARIRQIRQPKTNPCKIGQIRQKLGVRQKYFLPARQLSNLPEFSNADLYRHFCTIPSVKQATFSDGSIDGYKNHM